MRTIVKHGTWWLTTGGATVEKSRPCSCTCSWQSHQYHWVWGTARPRDVKAGATAGPTVGTTKEARPLPAPDIFPLLYLILCFVPAPVPSISALAAVWRQLLLIFLRGGRYYNTWLSNYWEVVWNTKGKQQRITRSSSMTAVQFDTRTVRFQYIIKLYP